MKISRRHLFGMIPAALLAGRVAKAAPLLPIAAAHADVLVPPELSLEGLLALGSTIIDYSAYPDSPLVLYLMERVNAGHPYHCFVDGVEIQQVWYCDQEAGIVKSHDVLYDNKAHCNLERLDPEALLLARARDCYAGNVDLHWTLRPDRHPHGYGNALIGVLSKTIRGKVELRAT